MARQTSAQPSVPKVYTPAQLAREVGVTLNTVRRWLRGLANDIRLEHGYKTARDYAITQAQVDTFFRRLAEHRQRERDRAAVREPFRRRPISRKHREATAARLRVLGVEVG